MKANEAYKPSKTMTQLFYKTTGVKGGKSSKTTQTGEVTVREWTNDRVTGEITVDGFTGQGNTYKRRDKVLINVQFEDGTIWSGNFETLKNKLL
jgi:hypothetical protein